MANYSILVDVNLQTQQIKEQLSKIKGAKIDLDTSSVKQASKDIQDLELNFNSANEVFSKTIDIISSLASQVLELDNSITEFKKVSDLSGSSLDDYVSKLSKMGLAVGRTGKPNRSEPGRWDGKPAPRTAPKPLKASRALSLQHKDEISLSVNVRNH